MKGLFLILIGSASMLIAQNSFSQNVIAANQGSTYLKVMQKNGKFGLSSRGSGGKTILPIEYDKMEPVGRMYFILGKEGKYGVIDSLGKTVVPLEYERINTPRAGVCLVKKGGKFGYIKVDGTTVIPPTYDEAEEFYNDKTRKETSVAKVKQAGKFGFVAINGEVLLEPSLEEMGKESEGLIMAKMNGKYGFLNPKNEWIVPAQFNSVTDFQGGRSFVKSDSGQGLINYKGAILIPANNESVTGPVEGIFLVKKNNLYGYTDSNGLVLSAPIFTEARPYSGGYAAVKFQAGYKEKFKTEIDDFKKVSKKELEATGWGFLMKNGSIFLPPIFTMANDFKNGIAIVTLKTGKVGYIDRYGKFKTTGK